MAKSSTCARDRRALQQLALNVHVKHSDLTYPRPVKYIGGVILNFKCFCYFLLLLFIILVVITSCITLVCFVVCVAGCVSGAPGRGGPIRPDGLPDLRLHPTRTAAVHRQLRLPDARRLRQGTAHQRGGQLRERFKQADCMQSC